AENSANPSRISQRVSSTFSGKSASHWAAMVRNSLTSCSASRFDSEISRSRGTTSTMPRIFGCNGSVLDEIFLNQVRARLGEIAVMTVCTRAPNSDRGQVTSMTCVSSVTPFLSVILKCQRFDQGCDDLPRRNARLSVDLKSARILFSRTVFDA